MQGSAYSHEAVNLWPFDYESAALRSQLQKVAPIFTNLFLVSPSGLLPSTTLTKEAFMRKLSYQLSIYRTIQYISYYMPDGIQFLIGILFFKRG